MIHTYKYLTIHHKLRGLRDLLTIIELFMNVRINFYFFFVLIIIESIFE